MRINFLYFVLLLVFMITVINLFHKPSLYKMFASSPNLKKETITDVHYDPLDRLFCPINGFKCPDEYCDCSHFCKGNYDKINVLPDEEIVLYNQKLLPGTYCLPTGMSKCNLKTSVPVFATNGWTCLHKYVSNRFCKHPLAANNASNVLIDETTGREAVDIRDLYEYHNGKLRYRCECLSTDKKGNKMVALEEVPFTCVPDYCLQNLNNTTGLGWDPLSKTCDCKQYDNEMGDVHLPCTDVFEGFQNVNYYGTVKCTHPSSFVEEPFFCPPAMTRFRFSKIITFKSIPLEYLDETV